MVEVLVSLMIWKPAKLGVANKKRISNDRAWTVIDVGGQMRWIRACKNEWMLIESLRSRR